MSNLHELLDRLGSAVQRLREQRIGYGAALAGEYGETYNPDADDAEIAAILEGDDAE